MVAFILFSFSYQNKSKRNLSSTSSDISTNKSKKNRPIFASSNRYSTLVNENENKQNEESENIGKNHANIDIVMNIENDQIKIKPPTPIVIHGILDFSAFRTCLIEFIGANNFVVKSNANNVRLQTVNPDSCRSLIKYLKENKAEFHTYQA